MTGDLVPRPKGVWWGVPNAITLFRVILTCYLHYYLLLHFGRIAIPLLLTVLILLSDFADGKIARRDGTATSGGAVFDLLADFFYMLLAYLVLHSFGLVPLWFLLLIIFKFVEFVLTSFRLKKTGDDRGFFFFDALGRSVAASYYLLPLVLYISHRSSPALYAFCLNEVIYLILFLSLLSSGYRLWSFCRYKAVVHEE